MEMFKRKFVSVKIRQNLRGTSVLLKFTEKFVNTLMIWETWTKERSQRSLHQIWWHDIAYRTRTIFIYSGLRINMPEESILDWRDSWSAHTKLSKFWQNIWSSAFRCSINTNTIEVINLVVDEENSNKFYNKKLVIVKK